MAGNMYDDGYTPGIGKGSYKPIKYTINENGCWVCVSHKCNKDGYVTIRRGSDRFRLHRYVYEREVCRLSDGEVVMHKCDNPTCFNPSHLEKGTSSENTLDRNRKGRQAKGERNSGAKLTEADVLRIRKEEGTHTELAKKYGVSNVQIRKIRTYKAWKYLKEAE